MIACFCLFTFQFPLVADCSSGTYTAHFSVVEPQSSSYQTEVRIILYHCSSPIGISMGGMNPSGFGWGYSRVRVRVEIFHPANDPTPESRSPGYRTHIGRQLGSETRTHQRPCKVSYANSSQARARCSVTLKVISPSLTGLTAIRQLSATYSRVLQVVQLYLWI